MSHRVEESVNRPALADDKFLWTIPLFFMGRKVGWAIYSRDVIPYVDYMFGALYEDEKKFGILPQASGYPSHSPVLSC